MGLAYRDVWWAVCEGDKTDVASELRRHKVMLVLAGCRQIDMPAADGVQALPETADLNCVASFFTEISRS